MCLNDLLDLVVAAHEDAAPVMDMFRHYFEEAVHSGVYGLAAGCDFVRPET
jgi:hypothetical protein